MALTPHWKQPSHPDVQEVIINDHEFTSKSFSKVSLRAFGLYAKMDFPPCALADAPTYATVQCGRDRHLDLNSDLLYINHSCEPSLIFDTANLNIIAGPNGLRAGEELTFFYPSTEWAMAQPFDCLCGRPSCRRRIGGARDMGAARLEGVWLNGHIRELLEEQQQQARTGTGPGTGSGNDRAATDASADTATVADDDTTARALKDALKHAEKVVEAARVALQSYMAAAANLAPGTGEGHVGKGDNSAPGASAANSGPGAGLGAGLTRRGATSRELSGEMGGDTVAT